MAGRLELMHSWIGTELGIENFKIVPASEDASFRCYFRIYYGEETAIIMDAPPEKEDCLPFVDIVGRLLESGVNAPSIKQQDLEKGFLLLDDLGDQLYLDVLTETNADMLYSDAIESIIKMQTQARVDELPPFNEARLLQEMQLFRDWLLKRHVKLELSAEQQNMLNECFNLLIRSAMEQPMVFVHRDYHSRNLLVGKQNNPGIIDFQDAIYGPLSYDLVSLLKDCYVKWPCTEIMKWVRVYYQLVRSHLFPELDEEQFIRWFDLMGVQRHLKASGIFARLYYRDQKAGFLKNIPRALSYILDLEQDYSELGPLIELIRSKVLPSLQEINL